MSRFSDHNFLVKNALMGAQNLIEINVKDETEGKDSTLHRLKHALNRVDDMSKLYQELEKENLELKWLNLGKRIPVDPDAEIIIVKKNESI